MITLREWDTMVVCRLLTAARATSLLPFKMLSLTIMSRDSHPVIINPLKITQINEQLGNSTSKYQLPLEIMTKETIIWLTITLPDQKLLKLLRKGKKERNIRDTPLRTSTSVSSHCFWAVLRLHIHRLKSSMYRYLDDIGCKPHWQWKCQRVPMMNEHVNCFSSPCSKFFSPPFIFWWGCSLHKIYISLTETIAML